MHLNVDARDRKPTALAISMRCPHPNRGIGRGQRAVPVVKNSFQRCAAHWQTKPSRNSSGSATALPREGCAPCGTRPANRPPRSRCHQNPWPVRDRDICSPLPIGVMPSRKHLEALGRAVHVTSAGKGCAQMGESRRVRKPRNYVPVSGGAENSHRRRRKRRWERCRIRRWISAAD